MIDETALAAADEVVSVMLCVDRVMRHIASELTTMSGRSLGDDDDDTINDDLTESDADLVDSDNGSTEAPELDDVVSLIADITRELKAGESGVTPP